MISLPIHNNGTLMVDPMEVAAIWTIPDAYNAPPHEETTLALKQGAQFLVVLPIDTVRERLGWPTS